jgi:hypothetical protein
MKRASAFDMHSRTARGLWATALMLFLAGCGDESAEPVDRDPRSQQSPADCAGLAERRGCSSEASASCLTTPAAYRVVNFGASDQRIDVMPPYGDPACPNRFVYDVALPSGAPAEVWLRTVADAWSAGADACTKSVVRVEVYRQRGADWQSWDDYFIIGNWQANVCRVAVCDGRELPDGHPNLIDFPWSWVDTADASAVRVLLSAHDAQCSLLPMRATLATDPF